jgi:hypothetical protein
MLDRQERFEFHRFCEQASAREIAQEKHDLEYALQTLPVDCDEIVDVRWMHRVVLEEISARAEVLAYRRKRLARG